MSLLLNEPSKKLLNLLLQIPFQIEDAKKLIESQKYTHEELTSGAINFAQECRFNIRDARTTPQINALGVAEGFHSTYLYKILELLMQYGIDVNAIIETDTHRYNLMSSVMWVDNGYAAADSMRLLLENGGNPNLVVDGESVYDEFTFDIFFGAVEQEARWLYECWVHTWFVLLSFTQKSSGGSLFKEYSTDEMFSLHKLKDHRNYDFCLSGSEERPVVRIFDKKTFWEVACF